MSEMLITLNEVWVVIKNNGEIFAIFTNEEAARKSHQILSEKVPGNCYRVEQHEVFEEC